MSLKSQIILIFSILLALLGSIIFTMLLMAYSHERVALAQLNRFEASELASRLQQSSDDLTRMARTYAVTGDLAFREYFNEIVAIRDGKAPRPENYSSIYWDFVTVSGERPSPFGPPAALIDQMKALGLAPEEVVKLEEAKENSDDLIRLEAQAFGAMQGLFADDNGALTMERKPDPAYALSLLHGKAYHEAKGNIMGPIGEFREMVDSRTLNEVRHALNRVTMHRHIVTILVTAAILFSLASFFHIRRRVIIPVAKLSEVANQVEKGNFEARAEASYTDEIGILNKTFNKMMNRTQSGIEELEQEIGERMQAEKALREVQGELEQALNKEIELNEMQRQFVSMASHEFRTPLAIIDGTAQRLKNQARKNRLTSEDALNRVEKIRNAVTRMTRLMESTLMAARTEEGMIKVDIGPCDIGKLVREVCSRQQEISQTHAISCDLAGLPETIQADAGSLEQVFTNLLSNAVKYAPNAPDIEVMAHTRDDRVAISVRDHGFGIDADELNRVGERFFRARTSSGTAGTGIGLNLVKTLVEMHGGTFSVESKKGEGSTFTIYLPIAGPDQTDQSDRRVA